MLSETAREIAQNRAACRGSSRPFPGLRSHVNFFRLHHRPLSAAAALLAALFSTSAAAGVNLATAPPVRMAADLQDLDRFIVRFRDPAGDPRPRLAAIGPMFGERLEHLRAMSGGAHVVRLGRRVMGVEAREIARRLRSDPRIAWVEPDHLMQPLAVPNDSLYAQQWHYFEPQGGIGLPAAWDITTGSSQIAIAVIDTGILPHADLAGRVAAGYDFISDASVSNDGDGRDPNAVDAGDYGCSGSTSSWHGTHVAGTLGAASNNGSGVSGINWVSKLVPVRVLGRCGGYTSDIVDGMRWAAGIDVPGVPSNPMPVRVENLSLGGNGACSATFQSAIDDVIARGTVVVVAAGNSNADASQFQPASCNGVIAVAATTRSGGRAAYSNYGTSVTIAAPGGGGSDGILSTLNNGTTTAAADSYAWFQGTSMASPHVAGVVSLMLSIAPSMTPAAVLQRLRQTARAFPTGTGSDCSTSMCGAGIVDAAASLSGLAVAPPAWTFIASEGQSFSVAGTQTVRYGSGSSWITRDVSASGSCTNAFFGSDPIVGVLKRCEVSSAAPASSSWTRIAGEGQSFSVSGTQTVRYGSGSSWTTLNVTASGNCTNAFFGKDPIPGVVKECDVQGAVAPVTWTTIASEGQGFSVAGTQTVRYGAGSSWIVKSVSGSGSCTNAWFGSDPVYGVVKQCQVAS